MEVEEEAPEEDHLSMPSGAGRGWVKVCMSIDGEIETSFNSLCKSRWCQEVFIAVFMSGDSHAFTACYPNVSQRDAARSC